MKIGIVSAYALVYGGVQEHVLNLTRHLKLRGHDVKIIAPYAKKSLLNEDVIFIGKAKTIKMWSTSSPTGIGFYPKLKKILEEEKFEILHIHESTVPITMQALFFSPPETTNILTFHTVKTPRFYYHFWDPYIWICGPKVKGRIAVSQASKNFAHRYFPGKTTIIPNGVDLERFNPRVKPIQKYRDKFNILFVGRLEPRKDVSTLIDAYSLAKKDYSNLGLIIVGDGPLKGKLQEQAKETRDVVFAGQVSQKDLPHFYRTADIFCSPATKGEAFGIVLLEAMASGIPVVACINEGYTQVIKNDYNGILVPAKNSQALASALKDLIKSKSKRTKLIANGLKFVEDFSWEIVADQIENYYYKVLKRQGGRNHN